jgi:hypothetical protein
MLGRVEGKRKVSPLVQREVRELVHEVARILHCSDADAGERLVLAAMDDVFLLERLAPYFVRDYAHGTRAWIGHRQHRRIETLLPRSSGLERLWMRFYQDDWAALDALAFALGRRVAQTAAVLLRLTYQTPRIVQKVAPDWRPQNVFAIQG